MSTLITPKQRLNIIPFAPQKKTSDFGWSSVQVEDYKFLPPSDLHLPSMTHHILAFHYKPPKGLLKHYCADRQTTLQLMPHDLTYVPAFADNGWAFGRSTPHCLHMLIEHSFLVQIALEAFDFDIAHVQFMDVPKTQDRALQSFAFLFQAEVDNDCQSGALFAESLSTALATYLIAHYTSARPIQSSNQSTLSRQQLKQTLDYMNAHLRVPITLRDLAENIHLSTFHFAHQFKQTMGISPYRYWQKLRLDAIRHELIRRSTDTTYQIAQEFGFTSASYFSQQFQKFFGVTPNQYRQMNR